MFTIKLYSANGCRQVIREAESFTILRDGNAGGEAEITLHQKVPLDSTRVDIKREPNAEPWGPQVYEKAIIENSAGRTTEIIALAPIPQAPRIASGTTEFKMAG